jgi:hypothetical protein
MGVGNSELSRSIATYAASVAFVIAFLVAISFGAGMLTAVTRGVIVAIATRVVAEWIARPLVTTLLDAMARDRLAREGQSEGERR